MQANTPPNTHLGIDRRLCGTPVHIADGFARVRMGTTADMTADDRGLVHGGFVFGLADYAAMLAVNDPNVVLGGADTRFLKPVARGDVVQAEARVVASRKRKRTVDVSVTRGDDVVMTGTFTCFVLGAHVLDG